MPATATTVRVVFEEIPPPGSYVVDFEDAEQVHLRDCQCRLVNGKEWELAQTLIGTDLRTTSSRDTNRASLRDGTNAPSLTLLEDLTNGLGRLSFKYRTARSDQSIRWTGRRSTAGTAATNWVRIGRPFAPSAAGDAVQFFSRGVHVTGPVRVRIVRGSTNVVEASRLIVDDIVATPYDGLWSDGNILDIGPGERTADDFEIEIPGGYGLGPGGGGRPGPRWWRTLGRTLTEGVHYGLSNATVTVWTIPGARRWLRL
jgi:hypothetical protein